MYFDVRYCGWDFLNVHFSRNIRQEKGQWTYWEAEVAVFLLPWQPPQALAVQKAPPQQAGSQEQVEEQELRSADVK